MARLKQKKKKIEKETTLREERDISLLIKKDR